MGGWGRAETEVTATTWVRGDEGRREQTGTSPGLADFGVLW